MSFQKIEDENQIYGEDFESIEECENDLQNNYNNPGHPIAYSGINNIFEYYRGVLSREKIKNILSTIDNYTLHKDYKKGQRNPSYSHFPRYQFQMDLVDVQERSRYNSGVRYLFTVIDTFTRFAFVRMLRDKTAKTVLDSFKSILEEAGKKPIMIVSDRGTEFKNALFDKFCSEQNIKLYNPDTSIHAAYIERFNLTLQKLIEKYLSENETEKYVDKLIDILKTYNSRKHRMTGYSPFIAETMPEVHLNIRKKMSEYYAKIKEKNITYKVGDTVRIARQKGKFSRGYKEQSSVEVFKVYKISKKSKIPLYFLETFNGMEKIRGGFYDFELTKTNLDSFKIEKVIKQKIVNGEKHLYVKWKGFDSTHNSWIPATDVTKSF